MVLSDFSIILFCEKKVYFRDKTLTELHTVLSLRDPDVVDLTEQSSGRTETKLHIKFHFFREDRIIFTQKTSDTKPMVAIPLR